MDHEADIEALRWRVLSDDDDIAALTTMLNDAYRPLAEQGMFFVASYQTPDVTLERCRAGHCTVVTDASGYVATMTIAAGKADSSCVIYRRPGTLVLGQFAVRPDWQRRGLGGMLIEEARRYARLQGANLLALDTSERATSLIAFYQRRGFTISGHVRWPDVNYRSVVMTVSVMPD